MAVIRPRRRGRSIAFFVLGGLFLIIDILVVVTHAAEPGSAVIGGGAITIAGIIGGVIVAMGFWMKLFGMLEDRLIDIERAIVALGETRPPPNQSGAAPKPTTPPPSTAG